LFCVAYYTVKVTCFILIKCGRNDDVNAVFVDVFFIRTLPVWTGTVLYASFGDVVWDSTGHLTGRHPKVDYHSFHLRHLKKKLISLAFNINL